MQATLIENDGKGRIAYDSLILNDPKAFSVLNSKTALKIVKSLADSPASAIDVSRKLKVHEQKIYYHVRRLERAGIIHIISNEKRHGMIAKIYSVVSPVIAAKLHYKGVEVKEEVRQILSEDLLKVLTPFISDSSLNAKIIIGDPISHGKYDSPSTEGPHSIDLMLFLGQFIRQFTFPHYILDTEVSEEQLKQNLILIGNPKTNMIIDKINNNLPIYFDPAREWAVVSKFTKEIYNDPRMGVIMKIDNPFALGKKILLIGGSRTRGMHAAVIAFTKYISKISSSANNNDNIFKIVRGVDNNGDKVIDDVRFIE